VVSEHTGTQRNLNQTYYTSNPQVANTQGALHQSQDVRGRITEGTQFRTAGGLHTALAQPVVAEHHTRDYHKPADMSDPRIHPLGVTPSIQGPMVVSQDDIRSTLKGVNTRVHTTGVDPMTQGSIIISQDDIRSTLKGVNTRVHTTGVDPLTQGSIILSQSDIRSTLKAALGTNPQAPVTVPIPAAVLQNKDPMKQTQRDVHGDVSRASLPTPRQGTQQYIGAGEIKSTQHRGKQIQPFQTQVKKVADGVGGSSTTKRRLGKFRLRDGELVTRYRTVQAPFTNRATRHTKGKC
jgi:hypothetical protein